jgi:hypothetical protein
VYFLAQDATVDLGTINSGSAPVFSAASVTTFAMDNGWLFLASGPGNVLAAGTNQSSAQPLATTPDGMPVQGIAAGDGYVAYFNQNTLGLVAEPQ